MVEEELAQCASKESVMTVTKHKSASVSKAVRASVMHDARTIQTRQRLDDSFIALLHRRSYDNIRVSDITKKAKVGRSTYYAHYTSKDDLLKFQLLRVLDRTILVPADARCLVDCTSLFAHISTARRLYHAIMGSLPGSRGSGILRECIEVQIQQVLFGGDTARARSVAVRTDIPQSMITGFVASGLLAVIEFSMRNGVEQSPQQLQAILQKLVIESLGVPMTEADGAISASEM
jgi:AcrR family transcriptional regulator